MQNNNKVKINALGRIERSSHKENKTGKGMVGVLLIHSDKYPDDIIEIGTGLTHAEKKEIWENKNKFLGKTITFEYRPYGGYDVPRFGAFIGFRDEIDI